MYPEELLMGVTRSRQRESTPAQARAAAGSAQRWLAQLVQTVRRLIRAA